MTHPTFLPPLPGQGATTFASDADAKLATLAHVRDDAPAGIGHNGLTDEQAEVMRSAIRSVRSIQRRIDRLNRDKSAVYTALKGFGLDPALVRKIAYRLTLSQTDLKAIQERDEQLAALWSAAEVLQAEFAAEDEAERAAADTDAADPAGANA